MRIRLDPASVEKKLVGSGRGGYCFEQNGLFGLVLGALGFKVMGLAARVYVRTEPGKIRRSHMLLKVDLPEGVYIADVGFGAWALSGPLHLHGKGDQETPHGLARVAPVGEHFDVQTVVDGVWTTLYRFMLEEQFLADYEVANWYCSTHPDSRFLTELMVALPARGTPSRHAEQPPLDPLSRRPHGTARAQERGRDRRCARERVPDPVAGTARRADGRARKAAAIIQAAKSRSIAAAMRKRLRS